MIRLRRLCLNLFFDKSQTQEDWVRGFLDHRARLKAALPTAGPFAPVLAAALADTDALAAQLETLLQTYEVALRTQVTGRIATDAERVKLLGRLRGNEGALRGDYLVANLTERQRIAQLLYPHGMDDYNRAGVDTLPGLLGSYLQLVEQEKTLLGDAFVSRTKADLQPYADTRQTQVGQQTATDQALAAFDKLHLPAAEQVNHNYHLLSAHFRGNEDDVLDYFDPRYYDEQQPANPGQRRERVSPLRIRRVIDLSAVDAAYTRAMILVTAGERLAFARGTSVQDPWPADALEVENGKPVEILLTALPGTGPWLLSRNAAGRVAHYHVELRKATV